MKTEKPISIPRKNDLSARTGKKITGRGNRQKTIAAPLREL